MKMIGLRIALLVLLNTLTFVSCSHHVRDVRPQSEHFTSINEQGLRKPAKLTFMDGKSYKVDSLLVRADSAIWVTCNTRERQGEIITNISTIEFIRRDYGVKVALKIGFLSSVVGGIGIGLATYPWDSEKSDSSMPEIKPFGPGFYVASSSLLLAMFSPFVSIPAGIVFGSPEIFHLDHTVYDPEQNESDMNESESR